MTPAEDLQLEADRMIAELKAELTQQQARTFDPEALAYLFLVPTWTRYLADRCKFPRRGSWDEFLAAAEAAGYAQQGPLDAEAVNLPLVPAWIDEQLDLRRFWMPVPARPAVQGQLVEQQGRLFLAEHAARLGKMIVELAEKVVPAFPGIPVGGFTAVPPLTLAWAELARKVSQGDRSQGSPRRGIAKGVAPAAASTAAAARLLSQRVADLVRGDEADDTGTARLWIEAGEALAAALGGELTAAVSLARRRVELSNRRDVDRRYLARFIERKEQLDAFAELMNGPDAFWALHYLGMGGVGKTMLLRHIGDLAPRKLRSPVTRVDFDRLSPDYPVRRPGELLIALAEDLRGQFTTPEHQSAYQSLHDHLLFVHEKIGGEPSPSSPLENLRRPEFEQALALFDALLDALLRTAKDTVPDGPPPHVILVLDTCEELVKAQAEGGAAALPHLQATFEIIERVHDRRPAIRVIFAGRRLLTLGGEGWRTASDRLPKAKDYLLPVKTYLRLHLIRGFDREEAQRLFARFETADRPLPADVREAILNVSAEHGIPASLLAEEGRPWLIPNQLYDRLVAALSTPAARRQLAALGQHEVLGRAIRSLQGDAATSAIENLLEMSAPDGGNLLVLLLNVMAAGGRSRPLKGLADELQALLVRYSPFNLSIYGQWYADDRELTAARIGEGRIDPYVELRIVGRIDEGPVRDLLPAVVLLRRFNAGMLASAFAGKPADFPSAFSALSDHEWLEYRRDPDTGDIWLEVDPNLYPRLLAYFDRTDPSGMEALRRDLGPKLAADVRRDPLRDQRAETIAACLILLPEVDAAQLCSEIEWRAPVEADWSWLQNVVRVVQGAEADTGRAEQPLLTAALAAAQAAVNNHLALLYDPIAAWRNVGAALAQLTAGEAAAPLATWLADRAALVRAAAEIRSALPSQLVSWLTASEVQAPIGEDVASPASASNPVGAIRMLLHRRAAGTSTSIGLSPDQAAQFDAGLLAALEALVDAAEEAGAGTLFGGELVIDLHGWAERVPDRGILSLLRLLEGRILVLQGHSGRSREVFTHAERLASEIGSEAWQPDRWADWRPPASLIDRVRLEWLRNRLDLPYAGPETTPQQQLEGWLQELIARRALAQIDGERLASAALGRRLALETVDAALLAALEEAHRYSAARQPICLAHRQTPPFFLTLARGWLARGEPERAEKLLLDTQTGATASAADAASAAAAQHGLIEVARRVRDPDRARFLLSVQASQGWPDPAAWAMGALTGAPETGALPAPDEQWDDARLHAWWRAQSGLTPEQLTQAELLSQRAEDVILAQPFVASFESIGQNSVNNGLGPYADLLYDALELRLVVQKREDVVSNTTGLSPPYLSDSLPGRGRAVGNENSLRLQLRHIALALSQDLVEPELRKLAAAIEQPGSGSPDGPTTGELFLPWRVGTRRAAELALDEGELLALRLPARAIPLLRLARYCFDAAGDAIGAFQAAILLTVAAIRAGATQDARDALGACGPAYQHLTEARPDDGLPELTGFIEKARGRDAAFLAQVGPAWRGWLLRLAACLLWETVAEGAVPESWPAALVWIEGVKVGLLAPELLPVGESSGPAVAPRPKVKKDFLETGWGMAALVGGVLALLAAILIGGYFGFRALLLRWTPANFSPAISGTAISIGLYLALWLLLVLGIAGSRGLRGAVRAWLASCAELDIGIRPAPGGGDGVFVSMALQRRARLLRLWHPFLRWGVPEFTDALAGYPVTGSYAEAAQAVAKGGATRVRDLLAEAAVAAGRHGVAVQVVTAAELASHPWEGWLGAGVAQKAGGKVKLRFSRVLPDRQLLPGPFVPGTIAVAVGETWAGLFETSWRKARHGERPLVGPEAHRLEAKEAVCALHVVGRPVMTTAGPCLQVEPGGYRASSAQQKAVTRDVGNLVSVSDLAQPALRLAGRVVILQAEPMEGTAGRESGRSEAAALRGLAGLVLAAGVPTVLVLPRLPSELANRAVDHIGRALEQMRPDLADDPRPWLAAADRIREDINSWRPPVDAKAASDSANAARLTELLAEIAWDVALFCQQRVPSDSTTDPK